MKSVHAIETNTSSLRDVISENWLCGGSVLIIFSVLIYRLCIDMAYTMFNLLLRLTLYFLILEVFDFSNFIFEKVIASISHRGYRFHTISHIYVDT